MLVLQKRQLPAQVDTASIQQDWLKLSRFIFKKDQDEDYILYICILIFKFKNIKIAGWKAR